MSVCMVMCVSMGMHVSSYVCAIYFDVCVCFSMWYMFIYMYAGVPRCICMGLRVHICVLVCLCSGCTCVYCREGWGIQKGRVVCEPMFSNLLAHLIVSAVCSGKQPPSHHPRGLLWRGPPHRELPVGAPVGGRPAVSVQSG